MKYIMFKTGDMDTPVIFPNHIQHKDMAANLKMKPISAGFFTEFAGEVVCYGDSMTLDIASRPQDTDIIKRLLRD
jgi:hypothetical protein